MDLSGNDSQDPVVEQPPPAPAQGAVVPPVGVPAQMTAKPRKNRAIIIAVAVVLAVVLGAGATAFTAVRQGLAARDSARKMISMAEGTLDMAQTAVEPGSPESAKSDEARTSLGEAKALYEQGFIVFAGKYREAGQKAQAAQRLAREISQGVSQLTSQARAAGPTSNSISLYFALYERYPRTAQGQTALDDAAKRFVEDQNTSVTGFLQSAASFYKECPGPVPASVNDAVRERLRSAARSEISSQESIVKNNKSWAAKLDAKKTVNFSLQSTSASNTTRLRSMISYLSDADCAQYEDVFVLLRDSSLLGEKCGNIASSPVRKTKNTLYFSTSQVSRIASLSSQMQTKLGKAEKLLVDL